VVMMAVFAATLIGVKGQELITLQVSLGCCSSTGFDSHLYASARLHTISAF
jgi:hypothetical protein